jgi:hypothetical protein
VVLELATVAATGLALGVHLASARRLNAAPWRRRWREAERAGWGRATASSLRLDRPVVTRLTVRPTAIDRGDVTVRTERVPSWDTVRWEASSERAPVPPAPDRGSDPVSRLEAARWVLTDLARTADGPVEGRIGAGYLTLRLRHAQPHPRLVQRIATAIGTLLAATEH